MKMEFPTVDFYEEDFMWQGKLKIKKQKQRKGHELGDAQKYTCHNNMKGKIIYFFLFLLH